MAFDGCRHLFGEGSAIDRKRGAGRHPVLIGGAHNQRIERPHLLVEKPHRIMLGIVRAEAVGADHFGEPVGLVGRSAVAATAHFRQPDLKSGLGQLPGSLGSGEAATYDLHVHDALLLRQSRDRTRAGGPQPRVPFGSFDRQ